MQPVESSNIEAIGYDPETRALTVKFKTGASHRYDDVSPEKHAALMGHGLMGHGVKDHSVGKYFHAHIKSHKSTKLDG